MTDDFQVQRSGYTAHDRYPNLFAATEMLSRNRRIDVRRVLSFGCSTGEEVSTLATKYFGNSFIVGLDINEESIGTARQNVQVGGRTRFELSNPETVQRNGPYDIIFALGVLCRWPDSAKLDDLNGVFRFADFEAIVGLLDASLRTGGIMVLNGCNYQFLDTPISDRYATALFASVMNNGAVSRFDYNGRKQTRHEGTDSIYVKLEKSGLPSTAGFSNRRVMDATGTIIGTLSTTRR